MPSRYDELPEDQAERIEREYGDQLDREDVRRHEERDNRLQVSSLGPSPVNEGSRGLPATPQDDRHFPTTGTWPKVCACCNRSFERFAFGLLDQPSGGGFMGYVEKGVRVTLELRQCTCKNTLSHTEVA